MKKKILTALALSISICGSFIPQFNSVSAAEAIPAFPGAEGGGMYATGGRGGAVVHVTNLNDSGAGSLRDAVAHSGRIVVFDVGGTINLKSDISCAGNVTVAGQTAPGGKGITLKGGKFAFGGDNTIVRFLSSRPGEKGVESDYDAWGGSKGSNSIIDHCSIGWANDEQFGLYSASSQTVQYSIIGPSNCVSYHSKGAHGFGVMFGAANNSWHHNLLCHSLSRNFRGKVSGSNPMDFVNNVIYDWGYQTAYGTMGHLNYVNNYLKMGPSTKGGQRFLNMSSGTHYELFRFYLTGNKIMRPDGSAYSDAVNANNWNGGINYGSHGGESDYRVNSYFPISASNGADVSIARDPESADTAFSHVVSYAGASTDPADNAAAGYDYNYDGTRTKIDAQVLYETRTGTGTLTGGREFSTVTDSAVKDAISTYGIQYCDYNSYYPSAVTEKTITDTDNDGMPDEWELARGLDPNRASDATGDYLNQGYNNIEYYINDLTVNAFPKGVVTASPELVDLGEEYANAKADADALSLSPTVIKEVGDLTLPVKGAHGSSVAWSSSSSAIVIKNNRITQVTRPNSAGAGVTLTATVTNGKFTIKRSFLITVLGLPTKFDFGGGTVQDGYSAVSASTVYSEGSSYGFVSGGEQSDMTRAPGAVPEGYDDLYNDQVSGITRFKAEMPNGKYTVVVHYGSWNEDFGTNFTVEGVNSGNLASTVAAQFVAEVEIADGVLDVEINKGAKKYGGYINGLEILTKALPTEYHFDFGDGDVQEGYDGVTSKTIYSVMTGYGFTDGATEGMTRAPGDIPDGYANLYNDQILGETRFKADIQNGEYIVTIYYGSWNDGFGANYTVEGASSGNLFSTSAAKYTARVKVTDGSMDLTVGNGNRSYGGYISGMDIEPALTLPFHFDFGNDAVQSGYTAVTSSTVYSDTIGFGFAESAQQNGMTRAPGGIPIGYEDLYNDQVLGETQFKVKIPSGRYKVTIHYGSWNGDFGANYTIENVSSGNLNSTEPARYIAEVDVTDGTLDLAIAKGAKKYGGYISGMDVERSGSAPVPTQTASPTATPNPTQTAAPTATPNPTQTAAPTATPNPTQTASPSDAYIKAELSEIDGLRNIKVSPVNCESGVIVAAFYKGGVLVNCNIAAYTGESVDFKISEAADCAVIMLWNTLEGMAPVCEANHVEL